jgi:hypothetical protein
MSRVTVFFGKIAALLLIAGIPYYMLLTRQIKKLDPFYWKATYASPNLIIGASRAQKGIAPVVLQEALKLEDKALNLAFTAVDSPYGKPYFDLIKRKIKDTPTGKLFILSVHPISIMDYEAANGRREEGFRFYDLWAVNANPNYEYLFRNVNGVQSLLPQLLFKGKQGREYDIIHDDGWIERTYPEERKPKSIDEVRALSIRPVRSAKREKWLRKTVQFLKEQGVVVLVRMPVRQDILSREEEVFPEFSTFVASMADDEGVSFLDYSAQGDDFTYFDAFHHLDGQGARSFTRLLAEDIQEHSQ